MELNLFNHNLPKLNEKEIWLAKYIYLVFDNNREEYFTNGQLRDIVSAAHEVRVSGAIMRKIMNHIRIHGLVENGMIIGTSKGYRLTTDRKMQLSYLLSLRERISNIQYLQAQCHKQFKLTELNRKS